MSGLEILKMLSAKTTSIESIPGGIPEITPSMVAAALGMGRLSDKASLYCRIKYQLQGDLRPKLESKILVKDVLEWAYRENWVCGMGLIPKLGKVALDEMLTENICKSCNGTKEVRVESKIIQCLRCGGTGHKNFSQREIARRLGINHKHYSVTWSNRYTRVINLYYDCEDEIINALTKL